MKRTAWLLILTALPLTALGDARGLPGPDAGKELDAVQGEIGRFEDATKDFRGTVAHVVQQEYVQKRRALMQKYQAQLDSEEKDEKSRRESAIRLFEDFLAKYHNDDRWTPDAMFRLAELYFEKSNDEYLTATQAAAASGAQITPRRQSDSSVIGGPYITSRYCGWSRCASTSSTSAWCFSREGRGMFSGCTRRPALRPVCAPWCCTQPRTLPSALAPLRMALSLAVEDLAPAAFFSAPSACLPDTVSTPSASSALSSFSAKPATARVMR